MKKLLFLFLVVALSSCGIIRRIILVEEEQQCPDTVKPLYVCEQQLADCSMHDRLMNANFPLYFGEMAVITSEEE